MIEIENITIKHFGPGDKLPDNFKYYRKMTLVKLVKMDEDFTCANREGHDLQGKAGDFLAQDGYGGFYPVGKKFHFDNYMEVII